MRSRILRIIGLQVGVTLAISLLLWTGTSANHALSAFWGGACAFVPALAYQFRAALVRGKDARDILRAQYAGEGVKFAMSILMFYVVFTRVHPLVAPLFFATYVAALLCYFVALLTDHD
ncbi:MAG: ATP synthase subunit I [Pseudomonadota bacterium]|nr:ATP synthase subunit I [Pseudomonadota bacterium]